MKLRNLNESMNLPMEGFFWIIDNQILGTAQEVPEYGYEYTQSKTHQETWDKLKPKDCDKEFDYYPRGRVMVDPEYDLDNKFKYFTCMIFLDPCIDNEICKEMIIDYYNLDVPKMHEIKWFGNLKQRAGINHYTCHNCRK